jgi:hypothetical protein
VNVTRAFDRLVSWWFTQPLSRRVVAVFAAFAVAYGVPGFIQTAMGNDFADGFPISILCACAVGWGTRARELRLKRQRG